MVVMIGSIGVKDDEIERGFCGNYLCDLCDHCVQKPVLGESKVVIDKQISGGTRHPFSKSFSRRRIFERSCEPRAPSPASTLVKVISDAAPCVWIRMTARSSCAYTLLELQSERRKSPTTGG